MDNLIGIAVFGYSFFGPKACVCVHVFIILLLLLHSCTLLYSLRNVYPTLNNLMEQVTTIKWYRLGLELEVDDFRLQVGKPSEYRQSQKAE